MFKYFALGVASIGLAQDAYWNYDYKDEVSGPDAWHLNYPDCGKLLQSPINFRNEYTEAISGNSGRRGKLPDLVWKGALLDVVQWNITNDGHGVYLTPPADHDYEIEGGIMNTTYKLNKIHLKFGRSEHEANSRHKAGEIQMEFHLPDGPDVSNGRLMVAAFMTKGRSDNNLDPIFDSATRVKQAGSTAQGLSFALEDLLPKKYSNRFYTYRGSLTQPPCTQNVQWHMLYNMKYVGSSQLRQFDILLDQDGRPYGNEAVREPEKMNARVAFRSWGSISSSRRNRGKGSSSGSGNSDALSSLMG